MKYKEIKICLVLPYFLSTQTQRKIYSKIMYFQQKNKSQLSKKENIPRERWRSSTVRVTERDKSLSWENNNG